MATLEVGRWLDDGGDMNKFCWSAVRIRFTGGHPLVASSIVITGDRPFGVSGGVWRAIWGETADVTSCVEDARWLEYNWISSLVTRTLKRSMRNISNSKRRSSRELIPPT